MELIGSGYWMPLPSLSIKQTGGNFQFSWPVTNGSGFALYSTTNLAAAGSWALTPASPQTNDGQIVVTQSPDTSAKFFRLQR
jgi:hypothetical protein